MDEQAADDPTQDVAATTVAERLGAHRSGERSGQRSRSSGLTGKRTTTITSPADAIASDELSRSRALSRIGIPGSIAAAAVSPLLDADLRATVALLIGMAMMLSSNIALYWVTADEERYTERRLALIWIIATTGLLLAIYFFGAFSGALMTLLLGIYFVARGRSRLVARVTYATIALGHAAIVVGVLSGVLPDEAVLPTSSLAVPVAVGAGALVQVIFVATYLAAASAQASTLRVVSELDEAVREVARREAQLDEARYDVRRALRVGDPGRLTGVTLGSFELGVILGRGGMGEVYEAVAVESGEPAAVKVLQPHMVQDEQALERFLREARAAGALESPHVVELLEVGDPDEGVPYIAMERLRGHDLATRLRERGTMKAEDVVKLVHECARGLSAAAAAGIVHRDIKPQNIFRHRAEGGEWTYKILDFGVSKLAETTGTLTSGHVVGTPVYMAPEQAQNAALDHRADVYSLGAVAYRCLTGRPPFRSRETALVLYAVVHEMPVRPSALATVTEDVDRALALALAKNPDDRFDDAEELATALSQAFAGDLPDELRRRADRVLRTNPWV